MSVTEPPAVLVKLVEGCRKATHWLDDAAGEATSYKFTFGSRTGTWLVFFRLHGTPPRAIVLIPELLRLFDTWSAAAWELEPDVLQVSGTVENVKVALFIERVAEGQPCRGPSVN
jgi:hypothetical protein